ncbi:hypothetical protein ACFL2O_01955 [Thermodesulfobacteriota bacterium]
MNVFVLCTGRCGSTTFIKACEHITNYSCTHESRQAEIGKDRLNYPKNHIEADNRLSWMLGRLDLKYGDDAFYVHLRRNENDTAHSFTRRFSHGIIQAYRKVILPGLPETSDPQFVSLDYCNTVNSNIEHFLKDKSKKMTVNLENIYSDFPEFWNMIVAEGDIGAALAEFSIKYNATIPPPEKKKETLALKEENLILRILSKLRRLIIKFPKYIKNA